MTAIHEFKCDNCKKKAPAKYNGEHWLAPHGWVALYDDQRAEMTGQHLCPNCRPAMKAQKRDPSEMVKSGGGDV